MARPALWGMVFVTIFETVVLALMFLKLRKLLRMNRAHPEGRQTIGVYSSLLIALVLYTVLFAASQGAAWGLWAVNWWGVWLLLMVPLIVPITFLFILHSTRDDYAIDAGPPNPLKYQTQAQTSPSKQVQRDEVGGRGVNAASAGNPHPPAMSMYAHPTRAFPPQLAAPLETPGRSFVPIAPQSGEYPPPMPHYPPMRPDMEESAHPQ
eukprot:TRINITY_DN38156_c0_g1_i1.p1 TRINITY_DN38156_c0_g1~~TRINITY_DN38156_c0_g1_i1.p1  ORF type:complete len:220 (+),score=39.41 TRINITY_DN38156_c0_g1_i1:37-660(+)